MSAKPCNRNAEKSFPVLSLNSRQQKPPNPLLIRDKNVLQPRFDPRYFYYPYGEELGANLFAIETELLFVEDVQGHAWGHTLLRTDIDEDGRRRDVE